MSDSLSTQATAFLADLDELCKSHSVQLVFNSHGVVELWPLEADGEAVSFETIDDQLDELDEDLVAGPEIDTEPRED